jgi:hypothetical protein
MPYSLTVWGIGSGPGPDLDSGLNFDLRSEVTYIFGILSSKYGYPVYGVLQLNIIKENCITEVAHGVVVYVKML